MRALLGILASSQGRGEGTMRALGRTFLSSGWQACSSLRRAGAESNLAARWPPRRLGPKRRHALDRKSTPELAAQIPLVDVPRNFGPIVDRRCELRRNAAGHIGTHHPLVQ